MHRRRHRFAAGTAGRSNQSTSCFRTTIMNANLKPAQPSADAERSARSRSRGVLSAGGSALAFNEGIDNHLTVLVPGCADRFLLAPFGMHWSEVRASDFLVVDFSGRTLSGQGSVEDTALYIHQPVHRLSPQGELRAAYSHALRDGALHAAKIRGWRWPCKRHWASTRMWPTT